MDTVFQAFIHLAEDEWSSCGHMERVAKECIERHKDKTVIVTVYEHGGWWLQYAMLDGELDIIGTANDAARFPEKVEKFRAELRKMKDWKVVEMTRRKSELQLQQEAAENAV